MYLAPDGDEVEIANAAGAFLAQALPIDRLHRPHAADLSAEQRAELGAMGWFALAVPEAQGGSGLSPVELALFFREAGRQCVPVDVLAQSLAPTLGHDPAIMTGAEGAALIVPDGEAWRLIGSSDAAWGVLAAESGASLHALGSCAAEDRPSLDPANSQRRLASLPGPSRTTDSAETWHLGQLGCAAMLVGIAEHALELIVEYAGLRETFGRKIGSWQAVRHPCADMAVRAEAARSQVWYAAAALKEGRADAHAHLAAAKHVANQAATANADTAIQLHGGIGVTDEHHAHLLLKHAMLVSRLFGTKRGLLSQLLHAELVD